MTQANEVNREFAASAVKAFCAETPAYIPCEDNSRILTKEVVRLYHEEGADPTALHTYRRAFDHVRDQLRLNETPVRKAYSEMSPEELSQLPDADKDKLAAGDLKRLAEYELQQRWIKPPESAETKLLREIFEVEEGFAFSPANAAIIRDWLESRNLAVSESNIQTAIAACETRLEPSQQYLDSLSADRYRKEYLEPMIRKEQAAQPKRQNPVPFGVKYTNWIHGT